MTAHTRYEYLINCDTLGKKSFLIVVSLKHFRVKGVKIQNPLSSILFGRF
jgi:hypothetical protein